MLKGLGSCAPVKGSEKASKDKVMKFALALGKKTPKGKK